MFINQKGVLHSSLLISVSCIPNGFLSSVSIFIIIQTPILEEQSTEEDYFFSAEGAYIK